MTRKKRGSLPSTPFWTKKYGPLRHKMFDSVCVCVCAPTHVFLYQDWDLLIRASRFRCTYILTKQKCFNKCASKAWRRTNIHASRTLNLKFGHTEVPTNNLDHFSRSWCGNNCVSLKLGTTFVLLWTNGRFIGGNNAIQTYLSNEFHLPGANTWNAKTHVERAKSVYY